MIHSCRVHPVETPATDGRGEPLPVELAVIVDGLVNASLLGAEILSQETLDSSVDRHLSKLGPVGQRSGAHLVDEGVQLGIRVSLAVSVHRAIERPLFSV